MTYRLSIEIVEDKNQKVPIQHRNSTLRASQIGGSPVPVALIDECLVVEICIDEYLWALYERTPKVDVNKVPKQIKTTVRSWSL
jgi:hypothetical protein